MLFGFDLRRIGALWRQGWAEVARWRPVRRILPQLPVDVHHADGRWLRWSGDAARVLPTAAPTGTHFAIEVPADAVLFRHLRLPALPPEEIEAAVRLDVATAAPFPAERCVTGWRVDATTDGRLDVTLAITSQDQIERLLGAAGDGPRGGQAELWAFDGDRPVVLRGFGERRREAAQRGRLFRVLALCGLALMLAVVLAVVPVWQARSQVFDAQARFDALRIETRSVVDTRDRLVDRGRRVEAVRNWLDAEVPLLPLLDRLTALLPDSAYLTGLEVRDEVVTASGLAQNAAGLMERLGEHPGFADFRPSGISRDRVSGLETFRIEFRFRPEGDQ
ncbi:hypothetical protein C0099_12910 [Pseudazoarcus pumilus]|uniref:Fimbrial assembly protein n=2 Tax=Pseudazoarcus pumilus TaxID=2067960 RepID=A0A2I6S923_9RHOO|nr:hypothetical protein C0099_12910 [Pseudazoarcus pumilus]